MARGQQKLQSQAKAQEKMAKNKKQQGHNANEQKKAAQKALVHVCAVCKVNKTKYCQLIYIHLYFSPLNYECVLIIYEYMYKMSL